MRSIIAAPPPGHQRIPMSFRDLDRLYEDN
jgi:hypothetical protein